MGISLILTSFFRAIGQLGDRQFRAVLLRGVGLTFVLLLGATYGLQWLLGFLVGDEVTVPWIGTVTWLDDVVSWSVILLMPFASIFLMVPVASAMTSIFLDEVAQAVEDRHYSQLPDVPSWPLSEAVRDSVGFLGILIAANLVAFAIYAMFPPFAPFIFWSLNGFLLGREYFQLAAMRRIGREGAKQLRRRHTFTIWIAGTLMAIPLSVPLINLLVPILGAATFTHLFHQLRAADGPSSRNRAR